MVAFSERPTLVWVTMRAVMTAHRTSGTLSHCPSSSVNMADTVTRTLSLSFDWCSWRRANGRVQADAIGLMRSSHGDMCSRWLRRAVIGSESFAGNIDDRARRVYRAVHEDDRANKLAPPPPCPGTPAHVVVCVPPGRVRGGSLQVSPRSDRSACRVGKIACCGGAIERMARAILPT